MELNIHEKSNSSSYYNFFNSANANSDNFLAENVHALSESIDKLSFLNANNTGTSSNASNNFMSSTANDNILDVMNDVSLGDFRPISFRYFRKY